MIKEQMTITRKNFKNIIKNFIVNDLFNYMHTYNSQHICNLREIAIDYYNTEITISVFEEDNDYFIDLDVLVVPFIESYLKKLLILKVRDKVTYYTDYGHIIKIVIPTKYITKILNLRVLNTY
jgi:hypothetical protein